MWEIFPRQPRFGILWVFFPHRHVLERTKENWHPSRMSDADQPRSLPQALLLKAVRRLLRPLVRLLMRNGITFPLLADQLRTLYVDVATSDILTYPKTRTDSRISLATGVHRKEIRRLREQAADSDAEPQVVTIASQIIARWAGSAPFLDASGNPRPLPRIADPTDPTSASFESLIASVTTDIRPRAVLDDWTSQGIVTLDAAGLVRLNTAAFLPKIGGEEQLFFFARNLHDHVAASAANIAATDTAPFLDRTLHYDGLTPDAARQLEAFARDAAMKALLEANQLALRLVAEEGNATDTPSAPMRRVNFGVYVYSDDDAPLPGEAEP